MLKAETATWETACSISTTDNCCMLYSEVTMSFIQITCPLCTSVHFDICSKMVSEFPGHLNEIQSSLARSCSPLLNSSNSPHSPS